MTSGCHSGRPLIATPTSARFREGLLGSSCRVAGSSCHGGHLLELYRQPLRPGPAPWVLPDLTICCEPHQQAPACPGPPTRAARRSPERVPTSCMNAFSVPHVLANGFRCGCWLLVSWSGGAAVGLAQDGQLVLGREPSPLGLLRNLGIWWAGHAPRINPGPGCRHRHGHEQKCSLSPSVNGRAEVSQLMLAGRALAQLDPAA